MSNQRTVLVESISYRGTDGEDHVGFKGDKVTVAADGVDHFDFVQAGTPEARIVEDEKRYADNAKPAKAAAVEAAPEAKK